jgi:hypothetical protein
MKRLRELETKAAQAEGRSVTELLARIEESPLMKEIRESLAAAPADPDAAAKCEKRLLELKLKLDEAADALEWPALVAVREASSAISTTLLNSMATTNNAAVQQNLPAMRLSQPCCS